MAARDITKPKPPPVIPETAYRLKAGMWESFKAGALAGPVAAALVFGALTASPLLRLRFAPMRSQQITAAVLAGGGVGCITSTVAMQRVMREVGAMPGPGRSSGSA
jgi:hypothetical protein